MNDPVYFKDAAALRRWFARNAATASVLLGGYMKKETGVASITWPESVDEALCVGWIDGVRQRWLRFFGHGYKWISVRA